MFQKDGGEREALVSWLSVVSVGVGVGGSCGCRA